MLILHHKCSFIAQDDVYDEGDESAVQLEGVEPTPGGGGFILKMDIPSNFYKYIIGRQGNTKASIEKETKCRIRIPRRGEKGDIGEIAYD